MEIAGDEKVLSAAAIQAALNTANALGPWWEEWRLTMDYNVFGTIGAATSVIGLLLWLVSLKLAKANMHHTQ